MKPMKKLKFYLLCLVMMMALCMTGEQAFGQQQRAVSGTVTNYDSEPLPGVSVVIKETLKGTITDRDGMYSLSNVPEGATLMYSFVGMITKEVPVGNQTSIDVTMEIDAIGIEEVVAVGYGTLRRSDLTGSVMSVGSEKYEAQPILRMDQALQGRAAGVQVSQTSGAPGAPMKIRIRGVNSITGDNNPLYVMDGITIGDIGSINVDDIASMEVLKDASATAIYGSRGANGVILITTKSGRKGVPTINFETFQGISNVFQKLPMMEPWEFAEGVNFAEGVEVYTPEEIEALKDGGGVDWQDEIFTAAPSQNYQLSFSGGNDDVDYYVSGSYYNADGTIINQNFKRYTLRTKLNARLTDNLRIGANISGSRKEQYGWRTSLSNGLSYDPTTPIKDENGDYYYTSIKNVGNGELNPVIQPNENLVENFDNRLNANTYVDLKIMENLILNVSGGVDYLNRDNNSYIPLIVNNQGTAEMSSPSNILLQNTNRLTYALRNKGSHSIKLDAIHEQQYSQSKSMYLRATDFFSDVTTYKDMALGEILVINNGQTSTSLQSFLGRVNYSFADKYLITGSFRADGSSKFREGNRWGYFPSGSVAWRVSQEGFMDNIETISNLKIRASYGITGSQAVGALSTRSIGLTGLPYNYPFTGDAATIGVAPSNRLANEDLTWEETAQSNIGLDLGLWNNKVLIYFDAYKKITSNLLLDRDLPKFVGPTVVTENVGKMENKGFEFVIEWNAVNTGDWRISNTLIFNRNVNTVLELVNGEPIEKGELTNILGTYLPVTPSLLEEGKPMSNLRGYVFEGVYQLGEEDEAALYNRKPGDAKYADINGPEGEGVKDTLISTDDIVTIGNGSPDFTFGLNGSISWKSLRLDYLFTGSVGNDIYNFQRARMMSLGTRTFHATHADYKDRWTEDNPSNTIPSGRDGTEALSSAFIESGSFLTLKNVSLSYTFKNISAFDAIGLDALSIYGSVDNAFIITEYTGFDPESTAFGLSDIDVGIDVDAYPLSRTFTAGVKITF